MRLGESQAGRRRRMCSRVAAETFFESGATLSTIETGDSKASRARNIGESDMSGLSLSHVCLVEILGRIRC
jgi:hypothetical protein